MIFRFSYLIYSCILVIFINASCSTAPELDRDNLNDIKSDNYLPDVFRVRSSLENNKIVELNWIDISLGEAGFIIEKSLTSNENFYPIDTLQSNKRNYSDQTGELSSKTKYRVVPFIFKNGRAVADTSKFSLWETQLNFDGIADISISNDNVEGKIILEWNNSDGILDALILEQRFVTTTISEWAPMDTLFSIDERLEINYPDYFTLGLKISPSIYNKDQKLEKVDSLENSLSINYPTNFTVNAIYEDEVSINWDDKSDFETGFVIEQHIDAVINKFELPPNTNKLNTFITPSPNEHTFIIYAVRGNEKSKKTEIHPIIKSRAVEDFRLDLGTDNNSVTLKWSTPPDEQAKNIIIEQSINSTSLFKVLDTLNLSSVQYKITELEQNNTYYYRVRTLSSRPSKTIGIRFNPSGSLAFIKSFGLDYYKSESAINSENELFISVDEFEKVLREFNLTTNNTRKYSFQGLAPVDIKISPDDKYIAVKAKIESSSNSKVLVFERESFKLRYETAILTERIGGFEFSANSEQLNIFSMQGKRYLRTYNVISKTLIGELETDINFSEKTYFIRHPDDDTFVLLIDSNSYLYNFDKQTVESFFPHRYSSLRHPVIYSNRMFFSHSDGIAQVRLSSRTTSDILDDEYGLETLDYLASRDNFIYARRQGLYILDSPNGISRSVDISSLNGDQIQKIYYLRDSDKVLVQTQQNLSLFEFSGEWSLINVD